MAKFTRSEFSMKTGVCRRNAEQIAKAAFVMGLRAVIDKSRVSASHYVYVSSGDESEESLKSRCSDHDDRNGGSDWQAWDDECPSKAIARIAARFGKEIPAGFTQEDYEVRSDSAKKAARTRWRNRVETERRMEREVVDALDDGTLKNTRACAKVLDELYPDLPRKTRGRIAYAASQTIAFEHALRQARGNLDQLFALLDKPYGKSNVVLKEIHAMIGRDGLLARRPSGYPKVEWREEVEAISAIL